MSCQCKAQQPCPVTGNDGEVPVVPMTVFLHILPIQRAKLVPAPGIHRGNLLVHMSQAIVPAQGNSGLYLQSMK